MSIKRERQDPRRRYVFYDEQFYLLLYTSIHHKHKITYTQSNRFKTMDSTTNAEVRKAMAKIERSGKSKSDTLRYSAKDVKSFMEKKTSLW